MPKIFASGDQVAVPSTEHTLVTITQQGTYELQVDMTDLTGTELLTLRAYSKILNSSSEVLMDSHQLKATHPIQLLRTVPRGTPFYLRYSIEQTNGTGRTFPWSVIAY